MQLTVFGASGRVGQLVVVLALERGHTVRAFVHSRDPFEAETGLTVIKGDVSDSAAVGEVLLGSDAVISVLGSWGTKDKNVLTTGMQAIIPAAEEQGIKRLVTLTGGGAVWSGDKPGLIDRSSHALFGLVAPKILRDGETHLQLLEASGLDWTCVRSPVMNDKGSSECRLDLHSPPLWATVSRQSVARCLVDLASKAAFVRQAPVIHRVKA